MGVPGRKAPLFQRPRRRGSGSLGKIYGAVQQKGLTQCSMIPYIGGIET
jgi:hypothetical protein